MRVAVHCPWCGKRMPVMAVAGTVLEVYCRDCRKVTVLTVLDRTLNAV